MLVLHGAYGLNLLQPRNCTRTHGLCMMPLIHQVVEGKPAPDIYLAAARRIGVAPAECLAFEDALSGVRSAKAAGMFVVAVPDPRLDRAPFLEAGADLLLRSLSEWDPSAWRLEVSGRRR